MTAAKQAVEGSSKKTKSKQRQQGAGGLQEPKRRKVEGTAYDPVVYLPR